MPAAIILDEDLYDIVQEEIPRMSHKAAGLVLENLMKSYVPENPEAYAMDYRLQSLGKSLQATLVIVKSDLLVEIQNRFPGTPLWIPPNTETSYILDGTIVKHSTDSSESSSGYPITVRSGTHDFFDNLYFPTGQQKYPLRAFGLILLAILPFAAFFAWTFIEKQETLSLLEETSSIRSDKSRIEEINRLEKTRDDLLNKWNALLASRPVNPASFLDVLSQETPAIEIQSLTLRGREFNIRAQSEDPVSVMKALSKSPFFTEVNVSDIRPLQNVSRKGFTLIGLYHGP